MIRRASYDAIVIGSGLGGSSMAFKLSAQGMNVLVVERGGHLETPPVRPGEPIGRSRTEFAPGNRPLSFVGGATKFYGAALYRMRESDFREVLHEAGPSPAWPITYADLEPFYSEAERLFRVHGSTEGDRTAPPRSAPLPHPPLPHDPLVAEMASRLGASGTDVSPIPLALDYGSQGKCRLCSKCDGYVCRIDAKMDAEIAALRPALATGRVDLATSAECLRVLTSPCGTMATGASIRWDSQVLDVSSNVVVVACGLPGTALLLHRSRNDAHAQGLGNNGGALGRYLGGHHSGLVFPLMGWRPIAPGYTKTFGINAYYEPTADWPYPTGLIQMAGDLPIWDWLPQPFRSVADAFASRTLTMFYMTEAIPTPQSGLIFRNDRLAGRTQPPRSARTVARLRRATISALRAAGYRSLAPRGCALWHEVGTARMGDDPASSVVDRNGMVHGIRGLYISDASVLPSAGAVNTALTIIALALRTGSAIVGATADVARASAPPCDGAPHSEKLP
ncbi:MAG: GMC family oxidoreductase [Rhizobiaceae bacterium]|nr:GMC family oxidoreductase [Rhizobiaceae bacterium]